MPLATAVQVENACEHVIILALEPQLNELCLPVFTSGAFSAEDSLLYAY